MSYVVVASSKDISRGRHALEVLLRMTVTVTDSDVQPGPWTHHVLGVHHYHTTSTRLLSVVARAQEDEDEATRGKDVCHTQGCENTERQGAGAAYRLLGYSGIWWSLCSSNRVFKQGTDTAMRLMKSARTIPG
jgi:hypothetical protein